jgi:hypothetical protein
MQESEEHYSLLLDEEHRKVEMVEKEFRSAMREAEARLAEAALKEEHLGTQLYAAHMVDNLSRDPCRGLDTVESLSAGSFLRGFGHSRTLSIALFKPTSILFKIVERGFRSKRDCLALFLTSRLQRFDCSHRIDEINHL